MSFSERYKKIKQLVQIELGQIEQQMIEVINIREPLRSVLINFLKAPSKRIRPVLSLLYMKACSSKISKSQLDLLTVVELVHNASLIHDDVIDESKLRRGHKSLSAEFDNKLAVISGDYILSLAMGKLSGLGSLEIVRIFSNTIRQMCIGEVNQNFDRYKIGTIEDYVEKTKNKTAYLFETALVCCAKLNTTPVDITKISEFGINTGIAFQIRDDLINLSKTDLSKPVNNDIEDGIYNAPVIFAGDSNDYFSGIEKTKDLLNNYINNARQKIDSLPDNEYKQAIEEFLELLSDV